MLPEKEQSCMVDFHLMWHDATPPPSPACFQAELWPRVPAISQERLDRLREKWRQYYTKRGMAIPAGY